MSMFAIILRETNDEVAKRVREKYPTAYEMTETCFLVQSDFIAENVAVSVGIKGEDRIGEASGVVFRLNGHYAGFTSRSLWDWLSQAEEQV